MNVIPISKARAQLPDLVDQATTLSRRTYISVKGQVKAALLDARELELLESTLEILSEPQTLKAIKQGQKDFKSNRLVDWEDLKVELSL